jgi:hypothetical protein
MNAKKVVLVLVVVFIGFWMFSDPVGLAETAKAGGAAGWSMLQQVFTAMIRFLGEMF